MRCIIQPSLMHPKPIEKLMHPKSIEKLMLPEADIELDATGLHCPEPLMLVRNKMMDMRPGQVVKVTATDPSTTWDLPRFCQYLQHEMLHQEAEADSYTYWIRKGAG